MSSKTISRREFFAVATAAGVTSLCHRYSILSSKNLENDHHAAH